MLRRTLAVLTPALFALPLLLTPASQVYADADMDGSVYSGLECKYLDSYADEGQMMAGGDVVYDSRLGIGNRRSRMDTQDGVYNMSVACPLPSLKGDDPMTPENEADMVAVAVVDGTVHADVTCWIETCRAGIGLGPNGQGGCNGNYMSGKSTNYTDQAPYTQPEKYITQNVDWLNLTAPMVPGTGSGEGREVPEAEGHLGKAYSHLRCTLPERDDESPEAPNVDGDDLPQGISYIQSYYVMGME